MSKTLKIALASMFAFAFALTANASAPATNFARNMMAGTTGADVKELQMFLNACPDTALAVNAGSAGSAGYETMSFGPATKAAVMKYQTKVGVISTGNFYTLTRGQASTVGNVCGGAATGSFAPAGCTSATGFSPVTGGACYAVAGGNLPAGCTSTAGYSPTTGAKCDGGAAPAGGVLSGTVGTIDYSLTSGISNEEVGESADDVKVAGLELDLDNSDSDVQLTAVKLNFDRGTAATSTDFDDVADEVTVWLGTTKVATVDASEFNDDNDEEKTVSLNGAIVKKEEVKNLYVAISAVSNLDSGDVGDTWTVDYTLVRFVDAQGATTSEDPTESAVTFSFESFATATDVELKISEDNEDINDAHVINVDATDDTDNVAILSFNLEAEGDSDITIDALPVTLTSTEAAGTDFDEPGDIVTTLYLYAGETEIGSETVDGAAAGSADTQVVLFDDLDYTIDAGKDVNFTVKAKLVSIADALDAGDTIAAAFGETETDLASFDAEDESGENLADADVTGTVRGGAHGAYDVGITATFVSATAVATPSGVATVDDNGTFTVTFDVTAFDSDIYVDASDITDEAGGATYQDIDGTGIAATGVVTCSTCTAGANSTLKVPEGQTKRFTVTMAGSGADVFAMAKLESILYATTAIDGDTVYNFNMTDFKTNSVWLDSN